MKSLKRHAIRGTAGSEIPDKIKKGYLIFKPLFVILVVACTLLQSACVVVPRRPRPAPAPDVVIIEHRRHHGWRHY